MLSSRKFAVLALRLGLVLAGLSVLPDAASAIPYFARRYDVTCDHCHSVPPKLNVFGEQFVSGGYRHDELEAGRTWPLAVWVSGRAESRRLSTGDRETIDPFFNRTELISAGSLGTPWLSYFVEWRPLSQETRADGSLRDRSGRFEDLFVTASLPAQLELTAGQFRPLMQVDVSRRLSLSEPQVFATSLAGTGGGSARERSLRAFSPSGRSPAARVAWRPGLAGDWQLFTAATLALPGEFSLPLTDEAEVEASSEIERRLKGVFVEAFVRRGLVSYGGHVFYDDGDRYLAQLVATGQHAFWHGVVAAGVDRVGGRDRLRWSAELEALPSNRWGIGLRAEDREDDGAELAVLPYATWHLPLARTRWTLTVEQRLQQDRNATLVELGFLF